jgi:hypothetical protein
MYPVDDPQALRNPRPDVSYLTSGLNGLQTETIGTPTTDQEAFGQPEGGSRIIQWGWNPVGLNNPLQLSGLQDNLEALGQVGSVSVSTS